MSQALGTTLDLTEGLRRVSRETARAFGADTAGAFLAEADEASLRPIAGYHVPGHLRDRPEFPIALRGHRFFEEAWTTRRPIAATDAAADSRLQPALLARYPARSLLFVPMVAKEAPIGGLLLLWWTEARALSAQELRLVEGIGRQAGLAVANARLFAAQQEDAEVARALLTLAEATGALQELGRMLDTVAWVTPQLLGLRRCGVFLWEAATGRLVPTAAWGLAPEHAPAFAALAGSPRLAVVLRAIESREPVVVDADAVPTAIPAHISESLGIRSILVLPLVASGRLMGTMAVDSPGVPHVFTAKQIAIARGIAAHAAVAIQNAALYAETERRRRVAEELAEVGRLLSETLDPDVVGQRIVDSLRTLVGATASSLQWIDEGEPPQFRQLATSGESFPWGTGIVRVAVRTREAVVTPDVLADPRVTPSPEVRAALAGNQFRAVLAVPLTVKDRVIGALAVADRTGHVFDPEASALARILADQAAVALENARLFRETGDRLRETETLLEVAQALSRGLPRDEAMRQVARAVGRAFGADIVGAYFLVPGTETLMPIAGYRVPKHLLPTLLETPFPLARFPMLREAWQTGRPVWTSDYPADPRVDAEFLPGMHPRALLFAPTPVRGEVMGGLFVAWWTRPRTITPAELRLIEGVASQVGLALENAELGRQTAGEAPGGGDAAERRAGRLLDPGPPGAPPALPPPGRPHQRSRLRRRLAPGRDARGARPAHGVPRAEGDARAGPELPHPRRREPVLRGGHPVAPGPGIHRRPRRFPHPGVAQGAGAAPDAALRTHRRPPARGRGVHRRVVRAHARVLRTGAGADRGHGKPGRRGPGERAPVPGAPAGARRAVGPLRAVTGGDRPARPGRAGADRPPADRPGARRPQHGAVPLRRGPPRVRARAADVRRQAGRPTPSTGTRWGSG